MPDNNENIVSFHINIAELEAEKVQALNIFSDLFTQISKYDGTKVAPFQITGLTELNKSINDSTTLLSKMNETIDSLNAKLSQNQKSTSSTAKSNTELSLAVKEHTKQLDDNARIRAKLSALESQAAKETAAQKVELRERTKALAEEARANNETIQKKIAAEKAAADAAKLAADQKAAAAKTAKDQAASQAAATKKLEDQEKLKLQVDRALYDLSKKQEKANQNEKKSVDDLANSYKKLKDELKQKETAYANAITKHGVNSPQAVAAGSDYAATSKQIGQIEKGLDDSSAGAFRFSKSLSEGLSVLRTIAYIVPGLGIAGIFNLAFEGIQMAADALFDFKGNVTDLIEEEQKLIDHIIELNDILRENIKLTNELSTGQAVKGNKEWLSVLEELGRNYYILFELREKIAKQEYDESINLLKRKTGVSDLTEAYTKQLSVTGQIGDKLRLLNQEQRKDLNELVSGNAGDGGYADVLEKRIESRAKLIQSEENLYKENLAFLNDYDEARKNSEVLNANFTKFVEEEKQKVIKDSVKNQVDNILSANQIILSANRSTEEEQLSSLRKMYEAQNRIINENERQVLFNSDGSPNLNTTPNEKKIASADASEKRLENLRTFNEKRLAIVDKYDKIDLKAELDSNNHILEADERLQEGIMRNETKALEQRLDALTKYISDRKQKIDKQYEYEKSLESYEYKTPKQKQELEDQHKSQTDALFSDTENKVREITLSYGERQLKQLRLQTDEQKDLNQLESEYTDITTKLSQALLSGAMSWKAYSNARDAAKNQYEKEKASINVFEDVKAIQRLQKFIVSTEDKIDEASAGVDAAKSSGDSIAIKNAEAERDALIEIKKKADKELVDLEKKYNNDISKLTEAELKQREQGEKQLAENKKRIREEISQLASQLINDEADRTIEREQEVLDIKNKQRENEENAIENSTLKEKDKTALTIQLNQQKAVNEETTLRRINKAKHDAAVVDKGIAIANIIWNTEQAVMAALKIPIVGPALAVSYGVLGAISLAKVAAADVPSYRFGTPEEGHKGGPARYAEDNIPEIVHEPGKEPRVAMRETISDLAKGTHVYPLYNIPEIKKKNGEPTAWEQMRWMANQYKQSNKEIKNIVKTSLNIDLGFTNYKDNIIHGK